MAKKIVRSTGTLPTFDKKTFEKLVETLANEAKDLTESEVKTRIRKVGAVASRQFLNSVTSDFRKQSSKNFLVSVGSTDRAADSIEEGFDPGFVPLSEIFDWMRDKGIGNNPQFAFFVQRKLAAEGYEGRHVFEQAEEAVADKIDRLILEILDREDFIK